MKEKICSLLERIKQLRASDNNILPANAFYLDEDILCVGDSCSDIRYPYEVDGMNLWAHANGHIDACESRLFILKPTYFNENAYIDFWGGIKGGNDEWNPLSILGTNKQLNEPDGIKRYTVFEKKAAYYILDTEEIVFAARANTTSDKKICFTVTAINKTEKSKEIYLSAFIDLWLRYSEIQTHWNGMSKFGKILDDGAFIIRTCLDIDYTAIINRKIESENTPIIDSTVSKQVFVGNSGGNLTNALSLKYGRFNKKVDSITTADEAVVGDIIKFDLSGGASAVVSYLITIANGDSDISDVVTAEVDLESIKDDIKKQEETECEELSRVEIVFDDLKNTSLNKEIFNRFIKNVKKQVNLCALGKNYAGEFIGIRDVFQQLDTSVIWNREKTREKIILALNYIFSNGRSPRQFSVEPKAGMIPALDIREYIDQGVWIIETVYDYISFTNDYTILDEECSYYNLVNEEKEQWVKGETTTVLDHLIRIMRYLLSNVDTETKCLKILYGDWNDAIDGLGKTDDADKRFGNGVTVMATLQLYKNLEQLSEILLKIGGYNELRELYKKVREEIRDGLIKHALVDTPDGGKHIIHGWGDKQKYKICTPSDYDGKRRYSATAYSFWCISGMMEHTPELKKDVLKAYGILDSKYGIRTCYPHFEKDAFRYVGRVANITPGTYENSCAYVHSTMFSAMALFVIGEGEKAWEQIKKAIPITHSKVTKTPFVMPNSYCYNEEYCLDGESMGDWYTGSGCVLLRNIVKHMFGVQPDLNGVCVKPSNYFPTDFARIKLKLKGCTVELVYKNENRGNRQYYVNGKRATVSLDNVSDTLYTYLTNEDLKNDMVIEVFD